MTKYTLKLTLDDVMVVDNHCHAPLLEQQSMTAERWRRYFTEGPDPALAVLHVPNSIYYQASLRMLAAHLECTADEAGVLAVRNRFDADELIRYWLRAARLQALLLDDGYPPAHLAYTRERIAELVGCRVGWVLRLEVVMQDLILACPGWDAYIAAYRARLENLRAQGIVSLKSIVAYRTGLKLERFSEEQAAEAFRSVRIQAKQAGRVRIASKPLLDYCIHVALEAAAREELPVQFHTGYGDPDTDLLLGNPLLLRDLFETPTYRNVPIVLLHESYPYTRQAGYLATVYPNAYLDLSYAIPFLNTSELLAITRQALGVAPASKLMVSSDAVWIPELVWIGATRARRLVAQALQEAVDVDELDLPTARRFGEAILRDNALALYRLAE